MEDMLTRGWENFLDRVGGPMTFRVILQPAVAIGIAIRSGLRDARTGRPPFLWTLFTNRAHRLELLKQGWKDVGVVFIVAFILDCIYQLIQHGVIYPLELMAVSIGLALVPYALVRGLVTRIARRSSAAPPDLEAGNSSKLREDD